MDTQTAFKTTLLALIEALEQGRAPQASPEVFTCFGAEHLADHPDIPHTALNEVLAGLTEADIPTLRRVLRALDESTPAWLGFKIVTDAAAALNSEDTQVVGITGKGAGCADAIPGLFFATEDKEIVFSRAYSERDKFQMLDITRGPHMHNEQYAGVAWLSMPLEVAGRVFIFGAGEVPLWVARYAHDCGFTSVVLDDDPEFLAPERFSHSQRILLKNWELLPQQLAAAGLEVSRRDYVLVLTRGHMHDPEALVCGICAGAQYTGMMGCATKNDRVFTLCEQAGIAREAVEATHSPIGLKFGAKTPPELAMCVVAELVQTRNALRA